MLCNPDFSLFVEICKKIQIEGKIAAADQQKVQKAKFFWMYLPKTSDWPTFLKQSLYCLFVMRSFTRGRPSPSLMVIHRFKKRQICVVELESGEVSTVCMGMT